MGFYSWYRPVFKHVCLTEFQIKFTSNWFITIANKNGLEYKTNVTYIDCARSLNGKSQKQTNHLTAIRLKFIYYIWRNDKGNMTFSSMEQCLFNRYILNASHVHSWLWADGMFWDLHKRPHKLENDISKPFHHQSSATATVAYKWSVFNSSKRLKWHSSYLQIHKSHLKWHE